MTWVSVGKTDIAGELCIPLQERDCRGIVYRLAKRYRWLNVHRFADVLRVYSVAFVINAEETVGY